MIVLTILLSCLLLCAVYTADANNGIPPAQRFSLRQSFYHPMNGSESDFYFVNYETPTINSESENYSASVQNGVVDLKSRPANEGRHPSFGSRDASQHVLMGNGPHEPNVTDKSTIVNLAKMTSDAYFLDPSIPGWLNLTDGFNQSQSFGWKKDGLRGHVFANADNSTVIVAFKGTTPYDRHREHNSDRDNDNILFSCCCATQRKDPYWYGSVCDCRNDTFSCNSTCLTEECGRKDRYYAKAKEVVQNVSSTFPNSQLWMVGHSLGGALASLMGMTFHTPVVTFEAVPERLPAQRLGLSMSGDDYFPAYHFGNTADPVYMGDCGGYASTCSIAGYAFETQCFSGKRCVYDTSADKGWHRDILNHPIVTVIHEVLEKYDHVPPCVIDDCEGDCFNWNFF